MAEGVDIVLTMYFSVALVKKSPWSRALRLIM